MFDSVLNTSPKGCLIEMFNRCCSNVVPTTFRPLCLLANHVQRQIVQQFFGQYFFCESKLLLKIYEELPLLEDVTIFIDYFGCSVAIFFFH